MKDHLLRIVGCIAGLGLAVAACAQEHPFIASYTLTVFDGAIRIEWVMQGGSTCNGQDVERSTDGIDFQPVHRIQGICGDPSVAVPFNWTDRTPPEFSTVYYRIKLGFDGYTSIKSVVFDQLTSSDQRFFPSPMRDEATLVVNVPAQANVELRIWDGNGRLVLERVGLPGPLIPILLPQVPSGVYVYQALSNGRAFTGRFVKAE